MKTETWELAKAIFNLLIVLLATFYIVESILIFTEIIDPPSYKEIAGFAFLGVGMAFLGVTSNGKD